MKKLLSILALSTALLAQNKIDLSRQVKGNLSNTALAGIFTTKGDTLGFSTSVIRVPVGNDGFCFLADSTQASGVKWAACPGGAGTELTVNKDAVSGYAGLDAGTKLKCAEFPVITGDVTAVGGTCATVLPNIVTAGTNLKTTYNAKGQITAGTTAATTDLSDNSVIVKNNQSNTFSTGTQDFSAVTMLKARLSAGLTTTVNGDFGFDTTNKNWHFWANGADRINALFSVVPANGNCLNASVVSSVVFIGDAGAPCGSGGGGANPAGGGSEINARLNGTTFQAVTGSSTSGGNIALGAGNGFIAGSIVVPGFSVVRTDATHLSIGAECAVSGVNCVAAFGPLKRCSFNSGTMPATLTISGGQSVDVRLGVTSACTLQADYNGTLTLSGTNITPTNTASDTDDGSFYLFYIWPTNSVSGQFDAAGTEQRASFNSRPYTFNGGLTKSYNSSTGMTTVSVSPASAPIANVVADSGAVNAYVIAPSPAFSSLATGDVAYFTTANANTGASTINVNGLGVKNITKKGATALVTGDILAGSPAAIYKIVYDGTEWQLFNYSGAGSSGTVTTTGSPANGNLAKFSGSTSVTNVDLSGDVTTSGTAATTVVKVNGAAVPTSAAIVGTNSSQQIIAHTLAAADLPIATVSAVGGVIPRYKLSVDGSGNLDFDPTDFSLIAAFDDFISGSGATSNQIGKLGWSTATIGGTAPTYVAIAGTYPNMGDLTIKTAATANTGGSLYLGPSGLGSWPSLSAQTNWKIKWRFKLDATTSNQRLYVGVNDVNNAAAPANFCGLRFDSTLSDTAFTVGCDAASTFTVGGTTYTVDTSWHDITISSTVAGTIVFQFDSNSTQSISTNVPNIANNFPIIQIVGTTTTQITIEVDAYGSILKGLSR